MNEIIYLRTVKTKALKVLPPPSIPYILKSETQTVLLA